MFRKLLASEIECRVATVKQPNANKTGGGCSILLYKDARVDMKLLDEEFTPMGWKREHKTIEGRLYCTISVYDKENKQWVSKEDVGVESYTEKEKGQASDSFKRAGFNWGIGRELYTAPFIWINLTDKEWRASDKGMQPKILLNVAEIGYSGDCINYLVLKDSNGAERFRMGAKSQNDMVQSKKDFLSAIEKCNTIEELTAVWKDYKYLNNDEDCKEAASTRANLIKADNQ